MNSKEFKRTLSLVIVELENVMKYDLSKLQIDSQWSSINDVAQHVAFLKSQLEELSNATFDKNV